MHVIQLTDLHLRCPIDPAEVSEMFDAVARKFPTATVCFISGDMADAGELEVYAALKTQFDRVPFPVIPMLGNHDARPAFESVFGARYSASGFVQGEVVAADMHLICLDTHKPDSIAGTLCRVRLDWLAGRLAAAGSKPVYLAMHHPPCDIGDPDLDVVKLDNPGAFAEVLAKTKNVRHIFFGHVHRTMFLRWNDIPCTSLDAASRDLGEFRGMRQIPVAVADIDGEQLRLTMKLVSY